MTASPTELLQDDHERHNGREVEVACEDCAETWIVFEFGGSGLTDEQVRCPVCRGWGAEI